MDKILLLQFVAVSLYTLFMGFCFCDGFKLHILRKLLWFAVFLIISIYVFRIRKEYDLALILPIPTLLAILLCSYEKRRAKEKAK
jgi:hypothetical protein